MSRNDNNNSPQKQSQQQSAAARRVARAPGGADVPDVDDQGRKEENHDQDYQSSWADRFKQHAPGVLKNAALGMVMGLGYGMLMSVAQATGAVCELSMKTEYVGSHALLGPLFQQLERYAHYEPKQYERAVASADALLSLDAKLSSRNRSPDLVLGAYKLAMAYQNQCIGSLLLLRNSVTSGVEQAHVRDLIDGGRNLERGEPASGIVNILYTYSTRITEMTDPLRTY